MTTVEERAIEDAIWQLRHGYALAALTVLLHLQESSHFDAWAFGADGAAGPEMSELEIPDRAYAVAAEALYRSGKAIVALDAAAPIVVAAELRRLARAGNFGGGELRKRADELDPEGATR